METKRRHKCEGRRRIALPGDRIAMRSTMSAAEVVPPAPAAMRRQAKPLKRQMTPLSSARRKGAAAAAREWLVILASGSLFLEDAGKYSIMSRTGVPARDLRVLDHMLSHPSTIRGRERAIVINLEYIKAIITADEVLIPNSKNPLMVPFVKDLQAWISSSSSTSSPLWQKTGSRDVDVEDMINSTMINSLPSSPEEQAPKFPNPISSHVIWKGTRKSAKALPFEFKVLEFCLRTACRSLESETYTLEKETYPALDALTSKISTLNLQRVRQIKSRLAAISGRVQKVTDELEHLLDHEVNMAAMHLSEKLAHQLAGGGPALKSDLTNDGFGLNVERINRDEQPMDETDQKTNTNLDAFEPDTDELEMLLETYFVQIDGTLNKLSTLREYINDTEDYINIKLDDKQNQLLHMAIWISITDLVIKVPSLITSILGMNITIDIYNAPNSLFWQTTGALLGGTLLLYTLAIIWGKKSGLLQ